MKEGILMNEIERLTLINQFEILKSLNPEENSYYSEKIEILEEGYKFHYEDIFNSLSPELPEEDSRFVIDVLNMYRDVNFSKSKFNSEDLKEIQEISTYYMGFDYNDEHEVRLGIYAKFFIEKLDRFQELIEDEDFNGFNSHWEMKNRYRKSLDTYNNLKNSNVIEFSNLTPSQIKEILG